MRRICKAFKVGLLSALLLLLVLICTAASFGIRADVVVSGSMEPVISTGSLCFTNQKDKKIEQGDIIAYRLDDIIVTHRVVDITAEGYITKGDNNDSEDIAPVSEEQIVGKNIFSIKNAGYIIFFLKSRSGMMALIGSIIFLSVITIIIERESRTKE